MSRRNQSGATLIEMAAVCSIVALVLLAAVPGFGAIQRKAALRAAATELRAIFHLARSRAIARNANCGLRFLKVGQEWQFAIYDDGDRDGIRSDDIKTGKDPRVAPSRVVFPTSRIITIGLPSDSILDPAGEALSPKSSPVRFGNSAICSFSAVGESSPGTIYIRDTAGELYAVRVFGATAKIRVLRYRRATQKWEQ